MTTVVVNPVANLSLSADTGEVSRASAWLDTACHKHGVPPDEIGRLDLCLNEALANIINHGGTRAPPSPIHLHLEVCREQDTGVAIVTISDSGTPFDPLTAPLKPMPKTLADVEPGGLGLMMIRKFSDHQRYRYSEGCNQLTFGVRWNETPA